MASSWHWRALRLGEWPVEVALVSASQLAQLTGEARDGADEPQALSRDEALWLFDLRSQDTTFALRSFVRDNVWRPSLSFFQDHDLASLVRQDIASGALVAIRPKAEPEPVVSMAARAESSEAPVPIRRAPPPIAPPAEPLSEDDEFMCPVPQALALAAAAAAGVPFCAECARLAAQRAAGGAA